ncbi:MAG: hypothetical protein V4436_01960 [Patescibacteria group bacterium]
MNVLQVGAIILAVACAGFLLFKWFGWLVAIFLSVPVQVYEVIGYAASIALVVLAYFLTGSNQLWPLLGGSLLFGAMLMITGYVHDLEANFERFFGILFILWAAIALVYQNEVIGFIAVGAFVGMLGFSFLVVPMGYVIGFEDNDALKRATTAGFITLALFVAIRVSGTYVPYIHVFEHGALWLGSFVGYLGLLIASSRWYENRAMYPLMQVITIILGMGAIGVGSVFGIPQLLGIGGTFFALYLIEKPFEIPVESGTAYAAIGLFVACSVGGGVWWAQNHMDIIQPFLLF